MAARSADLDLAMPPTNWAKPSDREPAMQPAQAVVGAHPMATSVPPTVPTERTILVVQDGRPAAGAFVQLFARSPTYDSEGAWQAIARRQRAPTIAVRTDTDGVAAVFGEWPHGAILWCELGGAIAFKRLDAPRGTAVWHRLELGSATVGGVVHDAQGQPRRGALVVACGDTRIGPQSWRDRERFVAVSDANGSFVLSGLPRELVDVTCFADENDFREKRTVDTASPNIPRVRFGAAPGSRSWRGRIVDSDGVPLPGYRGIRFRDDVAGELRDVMSDREGTFDVRLPVGWWRASVEHGSQGSLAQPIEELVDIDALDVVRDVRVSGRNLLCVVRFAKIDARPWEAELGLMLELDGKRAVNRPPLARGDAHVMVWHGLAEGSYRLRCQGLMKVVGAPAAGLVVDLAGPGATRTIELVLQ